MTSRIALDKRVAKAEKSLGFEFRDKKLLAVALTHRSFAFEASLKSNQINEKLEFLARLRANLVNTDVLASLAQKLNLGQHVFLGRGAELTGGRERKSILADCLEAVIGAMYVDRGLDPVRYFILKKFKRIIIQGAQAEELADFKTLLQEYTSQKLGVMPEYRISKEVGPVHEKVFFADVLISRKVYGKGKGSSKKRAEQEAARKALQRLRKKQAGSG